MKITNIRRFQYTGPVYNINCSPDHIFKLKAGVFTHNCGAGDNFVRSLTTNEIISQPVRLIMDTGIKASDMKRLQIMFMSQGEPMLNLKALLPALSCLYKLFSNAALLISTSGPKVDYNPLFELSKEIKTIGLQFSIHESTDEARNNLIPFKNKLTLKEIAETGHKFYTESQRQPFFNYCVHDKNNTDEDANRLVSLFHPEIWQATISVICERDESVAVSHQRQRELAETFRDKLRLRGFQTRVFDPSGQDDVGGGCGQLFHVQQWMRNHPDKIRPSIGYSLPVIHTPH